MKFTTMAGHEISLEWNKDTLREHASRGDWLASKARVRCDPTMPPSQIDETLIHELTHAASDFGGLDLSEWQVNVLALLLQNALAPFLSLPKPSKPEEG